MSTCCFIVERKHVMERPEGYPTTKWTTILTNLSSNLSHHICYIIKHMTRLFYKSPPPSISRSNPKKIATTHIIIPPLDLPIMEINKPIIARGMLNQFNQPRNGIIPKNIPHIARIPNILPKVFII